LSRKQTKNRTRITRLRSKATKARPHIDRLGAANADLKKKPAEALELDINVNVPPPRCRPLRVFAYDPSLAMRMDTVDLNEATLLVPWEEIQPGPVGEYIEVVDYDPASNCFYAPVDLNHPHILTQSGLTPSEALPQFHQQMVYAVAMKTIEYFERALGRVALWRHRVQVRDGGVRWEYVQRLRIYPHALRIRNAYFSPARMSLLLGYFKASDTMPGTVFAATSHDIIAHETAHALLDGLRAQFFEPTNPDIRAFHEAFADIVALFQHFTLPEALRHQIAATRGNLEQQNLLGLLAIQFGAATGRGALRDYIGEYVDVNDADGQRLVWRRRKPSQTDYRDATEPHDRGAVLVAAVFDAFLQIYKRRTRDLLRLATGGTEILAAGAIPADLVNRLAQEASKVARHILDICIRALDYCPPVDMTFGEYLRALITADTDLVPVDEHRYRTAFIAAFRDRGIYPGDAKHMSPDSLVWEPPTAPLRDIRRVLERMSIEWDLNIDRLNAELLSQRNAKLFWQWLHDDREVSDKEVAALGLVRLDRPGPYRLGSHLGELSRIAVQSVRPARRADPGGVIHWDVVIELTQTFTPAEQPRVRFRGGCTLIINFGSALVRYVVRKRVGNALRFAEQMAFGGAGEVANNYFTADAIGSEPFAALHGMYG